MADNHVITIMRGYGSGGRTMGKMLAEDLGWNYYDRELLRLASDESGINEELFSYIIIPCTARLPGWKCHSTGF